MRTRFLLAVLPLLATACAAGAEDEGASESNLDATNVRLEVVKGREYARCWFDVLGDAAQLSCTTTARGKDPLGAELTINASGGLTSTFVNIGRKLDIEAGGTVVVGSLPRSAFPVMVQLTADLTPAARAEIGETKGTNFQSHGMVNAPGDMSVAKPRVIGQPYDLWPVTFLDARQTPGYSVNAVEYTRKIAPYTDFLSMPGMTLRPSFTMRGRSTSRWYVAPATGAIAASVSGGPRGVTSASITGPGYLIATDTELRAPTAAEIAKALGTLPAADTSAPTRDTGTSVDDAGSPPASVDADPTCGGGGQKACAGVAKKCDDGTRWSSSQNSCVACGDAGQTHCFTSADNYTNSGGRCNAGTRWSSSQNSCLACGDEGQTYCFTSADNYTSTPERCNAGLRWSSSRNACVK